VAPSDRQRLGAAGERLVARWYRRAGYEVVALNWRCARGEIDLVCRRGAVVVICEVKARRSSRYGTPAEAVTAVKRHRLRRLAACWLRQARPTGVAEVRFDVAAVGPGGLEVFEDAF
jgi:putative endonuclease